MDRQQIGSSPLTRGKREYITARARDWGLIPAHAGKTSSEPLSLASRPAHPHSRRENRPMTIVRPIHTDSSPLTRGKRIRLASTRSHFRLIPAHAGKTLEKTLAREPSGAHPRSRGENISSRSAIWFLRGSSPLTRGKRALLSGFSRPRLAHPRSRGENQVVPKMVPGFPGSSPLTRGKRVPRYRRDRDGGLIPAHAGKTLQPTKPRPHLPAHPRSRGENILSGTISCGRSGSSPLTRGKQPLDRQARVDARLIPAHAGKTARADRGFQSPAAHPRSRGENSDRLRIVAWLRGSSPLTRGKRAACHLGAGRRGLIPAHAGKT